MIVFNRTRVEYGEYITQKTDGFQIWYATPSKGKITSYLIPCDKTEVGEETIWNTQAAVPVATKQFDDTFFEGNILEALHEIYIEELRIFNPDIELTNTLK